MIYGIATLYYDKSELVDFSIDTLLDTNLHNNGCGVTEVQNSDMDFEQDLDKILRGLTEINSDVLIATISFSTDVCWTKRVGYFETDYDVEFDYPIIISHQISTGGLK